MKNYPVKSVNDIFRDRFGGKFSDHQPLSEVMPMGMGGVSSLFVDALTVVDLVDAAKLAVANKRPYRVIGAGTATLIGESGFPGLIIKNSTRNIFRLDNSSRVVCDSGVDNALLVNSMASQGLGGIELLVTVPGTVGGATITNAQSSNWKFLSYIREICI
ncbi:MAG: FAD-binding protein, partial [Patescibacteria group bacterium]